MEYKDLTHEKLAECPPDVQKFYYLINEKYPDKKLFSRIEIMKNCYSSENRPSRVYIDNMIQKCLDCKVMCQTNEHGKDKFFLLKRWAFIFKGGNPDDDEK